MNIYKLLIFHAIITLAAAIVLVVTPSFIPKTVNIEIQQGQFLLCYFLAAAEFALAYLSFYSRGIAMLYSLVSASIFYIVLGSFYTSA